MYRQLQDKQEVQNHPPAVSNSPRLLYPRKEAAYLLGVSVRAVDYLIARGELRTRRLGGRVLVPHADLVKFASRDHSSPIVSTTQEVAA